MNQEEIKSILEEALVTIYKNGYNEAIEDISDYLYSYRRPKLNDEQLFRLNSDIRQMKK